MTWIENGLSTLKRFFEAAETYMINLPETGIPTFNTKNYCKPTN